MAIVPVCSFAKQLRVHPKNGNIFLSAKFYKDITISETCHTRHSYKHAEIPNSQGFAHRTVTVCCTLH